MILHIGHHEIKVIREEMEENWGEWDHEHWTIRINTKATKAIQAETLLHETIHAISAIAGLELDERAVLALENGLLDVWTRCPDHLSELVAALQRPTDHSMSDINTYVPPLPLVSNVPFGEYGGPDK